MPKILQGLLTGLLCPPLAMLTLMIAAAGFGEDFGFGAAAIIGLAGGALYGVEAGLLVIYDLSTPRGWGRLAVDVTWSLPNTLFGLVFGNAIYVFFGAISRTESESKSWIVFKAPAAKTSGFGVTTLQTLGTVNMGGAGAHEFVHVSQARIFGPLYLAIYALDYALNFVIQCLWCATLGWILLLTKHRTVIPLQPPKVSVVSGFFGWIYAATLFELWAYGTQATPGGAAAAPTGPDPGFLGRYWGLMTGLAVLITCIVLIAFVAPNAGGTDEPCVKKQEDARKAAEALSKSTPKSPQKPPTKGKAPPAKPPTADQAEKLASEAADECYCERVRTSAAIKQPISTWSAMAFSLIGLAILWHVGFARGRPLSPPFAANSMTTELHSPIVFGLIAILMGPGSMAFHATMKHWGGWLDLVSMFLFTCFLAAYNLSKGIAKVTRAPGAVQVVLFWVLYAIFLVGLSVLVWIKKEEALKHKVAVDATMIFILSSVLVGFLEIPFCLWIFKRNSFFFWASGRLFALAFLVWMASKGVLLPCNPDTVFQWHAVWHLMAGLFVGWIYLYLRTEGAGIPATAA